MDILIALEVEILKEVDSVYLKELNITTSILEW